MLSNLHTLQFWILIFTAIGITCGQKVFDIEPDIQNSDSCYYTPTCDPDYRYRSINGSCNNLDNPVWGMMNTPYLRYLAADYEDGYSEIRMSKQGNELPSTRKITATLFQDSHTQDMNYSMMTAFWGQFFSHDISGTMFLVNAGCCDGKSYPDKLEPGCLPIRVPETDPFYSKFNVTCMDYSRLFNTENQNYCKLKPAQVIANVTHYIDLSILYGTWETLSTPLRSFQGGKLKTMKTVDGDDTVPYNHQPQKFCHTTPQQACLLVDSRANQNPGVGAISVMMTREHNRLAEGLSAVNPGWDDETLYQEARRILTAQAQHITYSEYLPTLISPQYYEALSLQPLDSGYTKYNSSMRAGTLSSAAAGVKRTIHTSLKAHINLTPGGEEGHPLSCKDPSSCSCPFSKLSFDDFWWESGNIINACYDDIVSGSITMNARLMSKDFSSQYMNYFQKGDREFGDDLIAIDIMRGRDIGLPPYNQYRQLCGLSSIHSFQDLHGVFRTESIDKVASLYESVEDIDLFVGSVLEQPVAPGYSGPTIQCLLAQQFHRLKFGDRFFYEHGDMHTSFNQQQLAAIKKSTLASLICSHVYEGTDRNLSIRRNVFKLDVPGNDFVNCDEINMIDLQLWKEKA